MRRTARVVAGGLMLGLMLSAADVAGLWTGQLAGRGGEKQDISFQFRIEKTVLTGKMFGDEFDVPVRDLHVSGDRITFYITTTNFYDGSQTKFVFSGTIFDKEMRLTRERVEAESAEKDPKKPDTKQTLTLKHLT